MRNKEKLGDPWGIRLTPTMERRLTWHSRERGEEEIEIIRRAIGGELDRLDALIPDAVRAKLNQLRDAGLEFDGVVADALARKQVEDAQLKMPAVELAAGPGGGR